MASQNKPPRKAAAARQIKEFEGVRPKPGKKTTRRTPPPRDTAATTSGRREPEASEERTRNRRSAGRPAGDPSGTVAEAGPLVDPRSDPEVMFRLLSNKIAAEVDRAAMKAGASAAKEVGRRLTAELDAAIAGAQSTAGKMGTLVQQAVQAAVDEALRTAVLNATRVHEEHLAQLALIDRTAQTAQDIAAVRLRIEEEMRRSGISRISAPDPDAFNLVNPAEHKGSSTFEVLAPAYADTRTGRIVQRGEMRRMPPPESAVSVAEEGNDR